MQMVPSWAKPLALLQTAPASYDSTCARGLGVQGGLRVLGGAAGSPTGCQPQPQSHPLGPPLPVMPTLTPASPRRPGWGTHLEEGDDEGSQREVGGLLELGVKLLDGERGVLWGQPGLSTTGHGPLPAPAPPQAPFAPSPPFLLLCQLCHAQGKTTLKGRPRSRLCWRCQQWGPNPAPMSTQGAVQIPGDAGKTAPAFPGFSSIQHQQDPLFAPFSSVSITKGKRRVPRGGITPPAPGPTPRPADVPRAPGRGCAPAPRSRGRCRCRTAAAW